MIGRTFQIVWMMLGWKANLLSNRTRMAPSKSLGLSKSSLDSHSILVLGWEKGF